MWENSVLMGVENYETLATLSYLSSFEGTHVFSFLLSFIFFFVCFCFNSVIFLLVSPISQPAHQGVFHCYVLLPSTTVNTKTCILQPIIPFGYIWAA